MSIQFGESSHKLLFDNEIYTILQTQSGTGPVKRLPAKYTLSILQISIGIGPVSWLYESCKVFILRSLNKSIGISPDKLL